jgi:hypothetical protein
MTDRAAPAELPPPAAPPAELPTRRRRSPGRKALLVVVAIGVVIGGFFFARALYWAVLQPTPEFVSLATSPDPSLTGTVAFLRPGDDRCVYVVAASGGEPEALACADGLAGELAWRDDGRLQSTVYPSADSDDVPRSWIIDPATGELEQVPTGEIPPYREWPENAWPGPNGEEVTCKNGGGKLTLLLTVDGRTRTLLSTAAPSTYCMHFATWNGDGSWFVVKDDLDRLLLVTTADPSVTRLLVDGGYWPAVTDAELPLG